MRGIAAAIRKALDRLGTVRLLALLVVLGFGVRLANSDLWSNIPSYTTLAFLDEMDYDSLARNILEFGQFGTYTEGNLFRSLRPPIYPAFLASVYALLGRSFLAVRVVQAGIDSSNALLLYFIASLLPLRKGVCLFAAFCYALYGPAVHMCPLVTGEIVALFLFNLSVLALLLAGATGRKAPLMASAALLGILIHCRPAFLGVMPFWIGSVLWVMPATRRARGALVFAAVLLATLVPWGVRNFLVHRVVVPVSTIPAWHVFSSGRGRSNLLIEESREAFFSHGHLTEGEMSALGTRIGLGHLAAEPLAGFAMGLARVAYSWAFPNWHDRFWRPRAYVNIVRAGPLILPTIDFEGFFYLTVLFAVIALVRAKKIGADLRQFISVTVPLWLIIVGYVLFHFVSIPLIQYRFLVEPYTMMLMIGFVSCVAGLPPCGSRPTVELRSGARHRWVLPVALALIALAGVEVVGCVRCRSAAKRNMRTMSRLLQETGGLRIDDVRAHQFQHKGSLDALVGREVNWVGELAFPLRSHVFKPVPTLAHFMPQPDNHFGVFRLHVNRYDPANPLGTGDVRVNAPNTDMDRQNEGALVQVVGRIAGMTYYGAIIIDADRVIDRSDGFSQDE